MNSTIRSNLIVIFVVVVGAALFLSGGVYGRLGMMGGYGSASLYGVKPLTIQDAQKAVGSYLAGLSFESLFRPV